MNEEEIDVLDNLVKNSRICLGGEYMIMAEASDIDALGRIIRHLRSGQLPASQQSLFES